MKKKFMITITCTFIFLCIIGVIAINLFSNLPENPSKETLISFFIENSTIFNETAKYLKEIEGDVFIRKNDGENIDSIGKINTKDGIVSFSIGERAKDHIYKLLYKYGFENIYEEQHCIYFVKYSGFQWHKSLVYSKNGNAPPLNRKRDFAELGDGWYYYEGE